MAPIRRLKGFSILLSTASTARSPSSDHQPDFGERPNLIWTEYRLGEDTKIDWRNFVENPADNPIDINHSHLFQCGPLHLHHLARSQVM